MTLFEHVEAIESRDDLVGFIERLGASYAASRASWENADLASFLGALAAWVGDMDGYFKNHQLDPAEIPIWRLVGMMLLAARSYE